MINKFSNTVNIRTDLAVEAHEMCSKKEAEEHHNDGIDVNEYSETGIEISSITVRNQKGAEILSKPMGEYITISAPELKFSEEIYKRTCAALAEQIRKLFNITPKTKTLVVGLGNKSITPDALGPLAAEKILVTNHLKNNQNHLYSRNFGYVCAIAPGVLGTTGIETADIIKGVASKINPDLIIAVDSLAARSTKRISSTVQISNTGITPGSGVKNAREGINEQTLGIKVIAIGVPTVVDAATVAADSVEKVLGEQKKGKEQMNEGGDMDKIYRILQENNENMMVTPKDIDIIIERMSKTVANGINLALHRGLPLDDIESYVG